MSLLIKDTTVITSNLNAEVLFHTSVVIEGDRIAALVSSGTEGNLQLSEIVDGRGFVLIPGFVQTHVHLCQTLFRGLADDLELLNWLQLKIFPMEAAHNDKSMYLSALLGIAELHRSGTTTILDMGSINHEQEVVRAIGETGLRAFVGKAMMDQNEIYPRLRESLQDSIRSTLKLAEQWHGSFNGRVKYAVAPRFILSCTDRLMQDAFEMTKSFPGMLFHTHASENKQEIKRVRERCKMENIEFLHYLGVVSERSCLAHCIHLNDNEFSILKETKANVSHCPSSNLKLGSGIANVPKLLKMNISVSLGADGAPCNNTLDMFREMRLASLLQKPFHGPTSMEAETVFRMATINGAKALGLGNEIGSIEIGKKADLVLLNLNHVHNPLISSDNLYSSIVFSSGPENVESVMIDGLWVYRNGVHLRIDEKKIFHDGQNELSKLVQRMEY